MPLSLATIATWSSTAVVPTKTRSHETILKQESPLVSHAF
jgi:hypothetical protein